MLVSIFFLLAVGSVRLAEPAILKASNPIEFEDCGKKSRTFWGLNFSSVYFKGTWQWGGFSGGFAEIGSS
jgi:hypothetical protein